MASGKATKPGMEDDNDMEYSSAESGAEDSAAESSSPVLAPPRAAPSSRFKGVVPQPNGRNGKGVLLNFEDGEGKVWRFRYSYWNSSQSYVLTKGWSRFVKETGLRAGDTVAFYRSAYGNDTEDQLFIDYKKMNKNDGAADAAVSDENETGHVAVKLFGVDIAGGMAGSSGG
uniref:Uncharacterized protein n=1 Tax=Aegilops tauschii TaxID=37682 RepID=M8BME0_AEGTA